MSEPFIAALRGLQARFELLDKPDMRALGAWWNRSVPQDALDRDEKRSRIIQETNLLNTTAGRLLQQYPDMARAAGVSDVALKSPNPAPCWYVAVHDLIKNDGPIPWGKESAVAIDLMIAKLSGQPYGRQKIPPLNQERIQAALDYSTAEIVAAFEGTSLAAKLVGTPDATTWSAIISFAWMVRNNNKKSAALLEKMNTALFRTYVAMAKLKAGVRNLLNPNMQLNSVEFPEKIWKRPEVNVAGWVNDISYSDSPQFKSKFDGLVTGLVGIKNRYDPNGAILDYRLASLSYRESIEVCVETFFPGMKEAYVLRDGVPLALRDRVFELKERVMARLVGEQNPEENSELAKEVILLFDRATESGLADPPQLPVSTQLSGIDGIYNSIAKLLAWCERGNPTIPLSASSSPAEQSIDNSDKPDATGLVANPTDKAAYRPASKILGDSPGVASTMKVLNRILANNPTIRRWKPVKARLSVHIGDWQAYVDRLGSSGWNNDQRDIEDRKSKIRRVGRDTE